MADIYMLDADRRPVPLKRVYCTDESAELQELLASNLDLLPGDQIDPDDPCRWLLIRREVPVADPGTGSDRWSIDLLLADHNAKPTLVECKRFLDTRSRREVVGQMLEYAANGHYYWDAERLRELADKDADGNSLDERLAELLPGDDESALDFFQRIEDNLREGQVRLVFFLEQAPAELKSIVEFLNDQMARTEVLIVEARQFETQGMRLVAPSLFGFTEQARVAKRQVAINKAVRRTWNEQAYFADLRDKVDAPVYDAVRRLYQFLQSTGCPIHWGSGHHDGSFAAAPVWLGNLALCSVYSNGRIEFGLGNLAGTDDLEDRHNKLLNGLRGLGMEVRPEQEHKFPGMAVKDLVTKMQDFEKLIASVL